MRVWVLGLILCIAVFSQTVFRGKVSIAGKVSAASGFLFNVPVDTMRTTYAFPAVPTIPVGGGYVRDPTFGTLILRVSSDADSNTGVGCTSAYSYWPSINMDSTRIHAACNVIVGNDFDLWDFNPNTFQVSNKRGLFAQCGSALGLRQQDAIWSGSDASVIYAGVGPKLYSCNVDSGAPATLLKDFTSSLSAGGYMFQWSKSLDDNVFAATKRTSGDTPEGYLVWKLSTNTILINASTVTVDEVQIDKSGNWLIYKPGVVPPENDPYSYMINVNTAASTPMLYNATQGPPGHSDNGTASTIGYDNWNNCWDLRQDSTPTVKAFAMCKGPTGTPGDFSGPGYDGAHISYLANNEGWAITSDEMPVVTPSPFFMVGEIDQISTDGNQYVRHIAHSFSISDHIVYNDYPRANISRDGKFITFTSNWGRGVGGRTDVFVVAVSPAP